MPLLPSMPETAHLSDFLVRFPKIIDPLMALNSEILRGDGVLSFGEREMIAAFVSGLNACTFCFGSHAVYARAFGVSEDLLGALIDDLETAPVDDKMRPLLRYVKKLNTLPAKLVKADADAVFAAGWSEAALVEAVQVCAMFNFMNRLIEGTGVNFDYADDPSQHTVQPGDAEALRDSYVRYAAKLKQMIAGRAG
jgi:uncharacterized peroxidase-related enzyme